MTLKPQLQMSKNKLTNLLIFSGCGGTIRGFSIKELEASLLILTDSTEESGRSDDNNNTQNPSTNEE